MKGGQLEEEWCIADEQTPDEELQMALNWACQVGGADCSKIQENQACYLPNTLQHHASYAFNNYYQKLKQQGGTCYFNAAAFVTALDPSNNSLFISACIGFILYTYRNSFSFFFFLFLCLGGSQVIIRASLSTFLDESVGEDLDFQ